MVQKPDRPIDREDVRANVRDGGLTAEPGLERTGLSHFKYNEWLSANPAITSGWEPTCECDAPVQPCTVLDIFSGSATTGAVAMKLDRNYVGTDLNTEYISLAIARLEGRKAPEPDGEIDYIGELFGGSK